MLANELGIGVHNRRARAGWTPRPSCIMYGTTTCSRVPGMGIWVTIKQACNWWPARGLGLVAHHTTCYRPPTPRSSPHVYGTCLCAVDLWCGCVVCDANSEPFWGRTLGARWCHHPRNPPHLPPVLDVPHNTQARRTVVGGICGGSKLKSYPTPPRLQVGRWPTSHQTRRHHANLSPTDHTE